MRYYGPVDSHGTGREKIARKMLGQLDARMRTTGQTYAKWSRVLPDGTRVMVWITKAGTHPMYRAMVSSPQLEFSSTPVPFIAMESGLLVWSEVVPTYPVGVITNPSIFSYYEPVEGDKTPKIQLERGSDGQDPFTWIQDPPVYQDGDATKYDSLHWGNSGALGENQSVPVDENIYKPELFTGLMRAAVQAKVGAGLSPQQFIPSDWGGFPDGDQHGIVVDPGGNFWICQIASSFCRVWPLVVDPDILAALAIADAPVTDLDHAMFQAWKLAFASPLTYDADTEPSPEVMLWQQVDQLPGWPLAYGWHFDNAGTQAVEVRAEATIVNDLENWYTGRLYTFTFGFDDDNGIYTPTGSVSLSGEGDFVPADGYSSIWVPEYDSYVLWHGQIWDEVPFEGSEGPIYAFFNAQDDLQVVSYTTFEVTSTPGTTQKAGSFHGCGLDKNWKPSGIAITTTARTGGVSVNSGGLAFATEHTTGAPEEHFLTSISDDSTTTVWDPRRSFDGYNAFSRTMPKYSTISQDWTASFTAGWAEDECVPCRTGTTNDELPPFLPIPSLPDNGYPWSRFLKGTVKYREVEKKVITGKSDDQFGLQALFICATDAEAVVISTVKKRTTVSDVSREYHGKFETEVRWQTVWKEYSGTVWNWTGNEQYEYEKTYAQYWQGAIGASAAFCSGSWSNGASGSSSCIWFDSNPDNYGYTTAEEEFVVEEAEAVFIGKEAIDLNAEYDNWSGATTTNIFTDNTRPDSWARAMQAWQAGAIVRAGENAQMFVTEGWPERLVSTQRFIGGA